MAKTIKDYFIMEHEGHIPIGDEATEIGHFRDFERARYSYGGPVRVAYGIEMYKIMQEMLGKPKPEGYTPPPPEPETTIARMDAVGIDVTCVVPHWHTINMNVEPKGGPNCWVLEWCKKYPERLYPGPVFRPSIDGIENTLEQMEVFAKELNCKYFKIYPPGELWHPDDERYWPVYAKAQELGMVVAFHTGGLFVYGANPTSSHPMCLEKVCRTFYDLRVLAFHFGWPWHTELNFLAATFPNLYIGMSHLNNTAATRPMFFAHLVGEAALIAGPEKLIWSNDGVPFLPNAAEAFAAFEMPEELQKGYGYPNFTEEDKANIFGLTMAKLIGIEPIKRAKGPKK